MYCTNTQFQIIGWRGRKRWMDCVKNDMKEKGVSDSMTDDRTVWKKKTCCADPK